MMTTMTRSALRVPIFATLYALGFTNLFLRSSLGVLAPFLKTDMALTPEMLSTIASSFFFAYALMQLPTGMLLDRLGPRRTLGGMLLFTTVGAAIFAAATNAEMLILGRVLMGIGCAGTFTGAFYVLNMWLPPERLVTQIGAVNSFSALGTLCAATPLALLIMLMGWRQSYWAFTAFVALLTVAMLVFMRDTAPGRGAST
ncbi:MAG: MFS transporter, partial [Hyphomicrobium sp.]